MGAELDSTMPEGTRAGTDATRGGSVHRRPLAYRPYLDGLRAVAVYLVVAFHAGLGLVSGGFVGVDIFFVLSGFLVTRILVGDLASAGRIQWRHFYSRRVRRILPAAVVALVVTAVVYAVVASPSDMLGVLGGFRAALFYVANWYFIHQTTNYFAANVNSSPVLHFWSLAVEEQFYLLWPVTLGGLYVATRRAGRRRWWVLRGIVLAAALASAVAAVHIGATNLERAYYGTDTRAYQLLAGALIALTPQLWRLGKSISRYAQGIALLTLASLLFLASSGLSVSPITRGVLVATLAGALIIALENARGGFVKRMLSAGPFSYLGRISYGTYLWHWPVIVVLAYGRDLSPAELFLITVPTATVLAAISFHALERPLRTSRTLERFRTPVIAIGFSTSILVGVLVIPAILDTGGGALSVGAESSFASNLHLLDWRAAKNDIAKLPTCLDAPVQQCTVVRGTKERVLLIGDSYAQMWLPAFESIAKAESLTLSVAVLDACPWQRGLFYIGSGSFYSNCKRHQDDWYNRVVPAFNPDIVILAQSGQGNSRFPVPLTFPDGRKLGFGAPGYNEALIHASAATLATLREPHRKVVVLEPTPSSFPFDPLSCLSRGGSPSGCAYKVDADLTAIELYYRQASHPPNLLSVDLDRLVCPRLPICDAIVHDVIVRRDANGHLTATFAHSVSTTIDAILHTRGILGSP